MYTGSEWDHVGMVLRFEAENNAKTQNIYVVEASQGGVKVRTWASV